MYYNVYRVKNQLLFIIVQLRPYNRIIIKQKKRYLNEIRKIIMF